MANRYWVGNSGNWSDDDNHWATSSGGSPADGNLPTSSDDVFFDANSFSSGSQTVSIFGTSNCHDLTWTGVTNTPTFYNDGFDLKIYGSMTLVAGMVWSTSSSGNIYFDSSESETITTAGQTIYMNGSTMFFGNINTTGTWTLQDDFTTDLVGETVRLSTGHLNTNGKTVTVSIFVANDETSPTITLGSSTVNVASLWNITSDVIFSGASSAIVMTAGTSFTGGGKTYGTVTITMASNFTLDDVNTFATLSITGPATKTPTLTLASSQTISGTLTLSGNSAINRILVKANVLGTSNTLTAGVVTMSNIDFRDTTGAGAATWSGTSIGNALGNTGITFTTPVTRYWIGGTGNWSDTAEWSATSGGAGSASVPICHDTVVFDANSFSAGSQTVTADMPRLGAGIDFSAATNNPTLTISGSRSMYGALVLKSGMTITSNTNTLTFEARSSVGITCETVSIGCNVSIVAFGGNISFQDTFVMGSSRTLTLTNGTLSANNQNVTVGLFSTSNTNLRILTLGSGTWTLTGVGTVWNIGSLTNLTLNENTSTILINSTSSTSKTFAGLSETYNTLTITGRNVTVSGSNTFSTLNLNNGGLLDGTKFTAGTTQTVTTFASTASVGNLAILQSTSAGSQFTLSKASGTVSEDYLNIKDSRAVGGADWLAGSNSTNSGNNYGWNFAALIDGKQMSLMGVG